MEKKKVEIACEGAGLVELKSLVDFQGSLKTLSEASYKKLRNEIITLGFSAPFFIWKDGEKNCLLDGHQRRRTLYKMKKDGFEIPPLPVVWVTAKTAKEAKKKLLAFTNQHGKMSEENLAEFMKDADLSLDEFLGQCDMPEINEGRLEDLLDQEDVNLDSLTGYSEGSDAGGVPKTEIQGGVDGKAEYLILTFDKKEDYKKVHGMLGLNGKCRRLPCSEFLEKMGGAEDEQD